MLNDSDSIIKEYGPDKWNKTFSAKEQLFTRRYARLAGLASLRDIELGLEIFPWEICRFGLSRIPHLSAVTCHNEPRTYEVFDAIFYAFLEEALCL
jgi:hypothetical protein